MKKMTPGLHALLLRATRASAVAAILAALMFAPASRAGLQAMADEEMQEVAGQGLFWSDKISGSELAGTNAYSTPFTFYRMGLDGELAVNANISKLQLGCGGFNDLANANAGCDIDIDYVSLMGRNGSYPGNPLSSLKLTRPYLELAIKNDGTAQREIVGIKIGAQTIDGAMSIGRRYYNAGVNQENTLGWTEPTDPNVKAQRTPGANCDPGSIKGPTTLGCHSGLNSASAFLGLEMSLTMRVQASICVLICIPIDAWGCVGRTLHTGDDCGTARSDALFIDYAGTRIQIIGLRSLLLKLNDGGVLTSIIGQGYASINPDLRFVHTVTFDGTGEFGISFQREPVAYPNFSKMTPIAELQSKGVYNTAFDACGTTNYDTVRCSSAYGAPASTGWWLNLPSAKLLDIFNPSANLGTLSIGQALALFGAPGLMLNQIELNMAPYKNCYGAARFC